MELEPGLYLVPTPIGNLGDITLRSIDVLKSVDLILAEDTRVTGKLLRHYEITTRMMSYHQNNEHKKLDEVMELLRSGQSIACCTDAGSPGISDPGFLLTRSCVEEGIRVESLPGSTALIPALTASGIPCDRFVFEGFLPLKSGRKSRLEEIRDRNITTVLYESPHRLLKLLDQLEAFVGADRIISVSREISKMHHETRTGRVSEIKKYFMEKGIKGEFVLIISGK